MWDNNGVMENIALYPNMQDDLRKLDSWLMNEDHRNDDRSYDFRSASDDELCARYLGYLLRSTQVNPQASGFLDHLKTAYAVFLRRQEMDKSNELLDYSDSRRIPQGLLGQKRDGRHLLTLNGITPGTVRDLETRASVSAAVVQIMLEGECGLYGEEGLMNSLTDTLLTTVSIFFHLHGEIIRFAMPDEKFDVFPSKPWPVLTEINARAIRL
jgi:hypothetical protein